MPKLTFLKHWQTIKIYTYTRYALDPCEIMIYSYSFTQVINLFRKVLNLVIFETHNIRKLFFEKLLKNISVSNTVVRTNVIFTNSKNFFVTLFYINTFPLTYC